jgi:hypothetical protein
MIGVTKCDFSEKVELSFLTILESVESEKFMNAAHAVKNTLFHENL